MLPTVAKPVRSRAVGKDEQLYWTNIETLPLLRQLRDALNMTYQARFVNTTAATAAYTAIWTSPDLAVGEVWFVEVNIMARSSTAARSCWIIQGLFYNDGTVAQEGVTTAAFTQTVAAFNVRFAVVANHVEAQVQDDGLLAVNWQAWVSLREHPQ